MSIELNRSMRAAALLFLITATAAPYAAADFRAGLFELVHTAPVETSLETPDLREGAVVWSEMFDAAQKEIVIAQFYVASKPGTRFDGVIDRLVAAGKRGVQIRFLMEERGKSASNMETIARLQRIPNLTFRFFEYGKMSGNGIIHAKYLVVDGRSAYLGSQNFDWRSFAHIHETGVKIDDAVIAGQMQAIFDLDWQAQALIARGLPAIPVQHSPAASARPASYLVASPAAYTAAQVGDSEAELVSLLNQATTAVDVQLLDYAPLSYGPNHTRPYYAVIDNALRAAQARGVKIRLMVSNWNTEAPAIDYLKSLAVLPGVEVRIVTLPEAAQGFIPYARVIHSKMMCIDGRIAWIGTSNWAGGYLDKSRNLELVLRDPGFARRVQQLYGQTWESSYAAPLDIARQYPKPVKSH